MDLMKDLMTWILWLGGAVGLAVVGFVIWLIRFRASGEERGE